MIYQIRKSVIAPAEYRVLHQLIYDYHLGYSVFQPIISSCSRNVLKSKMIRKIGVLENVWEFKALIPNTHAILLRGVLQVRHAFQRKSFADALPRGYRCVRDGTL